MTTLKVGDNAPGFSAKTKMEKRFNSIDFKGKKVGSIFLSESEYTRMYSGSMQFKRQLSNFCKQGL